MFESMIFIFLLLVIAFILSCLLLRRVQLKKYRDMSIDKLRNTYFVAKSVNQAITTLIKPVTSGLTFIFSIPIAIIVILKVDADLVGMLFNGGLILLSVLLIAGNLLFCSSYSASLIEIALKEKEGSSRPIDNL
ncbi:MAG: hypothetical protein ACFNVR_04260 [Selenomonas noxia]|mgnify:CR=1 FL=1|nr:MAG TPA: Protein of unknown function (DUF3290) [Caudoviricetes sp.]